MSEEWTIDSEHSKKMYLAHLEKQWDEHKYIKIKMKTGKQRTNQQNAALHKYCEMLASELNSKGLDMDFVLNHDISVPWTQTLIKELIWRPVQEAVADEKSTAKAGRKDYVEIYDVINRYISGKFGVYVGWPCKDNNA
jgi:hypothetical protein